MSDVLSYATDEIIRVEAIARQGKTKEVGMSAEAYVKVKQLASSLLEHAVGMECVKNIAYNTTYFQAPGSPVNYWFHSNFEGGLILHSLLVTLELIRLSKLYQAFDDDPLQIFRVGLLHDMCKAVYNRPPDDYHKNWWYKRPTMPGHAELTLATLPTLGIALNEKETTAIRWHMGAFNVDKDGLKFYDVAKRVHPKEVLVTHWADMASANFHEWSVTPVSEEEKENKKHEQEAIDKDRREVSPVDGVVA